MLIASSRGFIPPLNHERDDKTITKVINNSCQITFVITIAERLKQTREHLGMSQGDLAKAAGVSQGTIGNVESGIRKAPRELLAIAKALGVPPEWLKDGKGPQKLDSGELTEEARPATIKYAHRAGVVQGGDNGFIETYDPAPTLQESEPIAYVSTKTDERAYAVKVRGNSMEPTIMAGWDVVASPARSAEPPDLCVVHFTNERKALKRLVWVRDGMVCLESLNAAHQKITEPTANIIRMDKVISIVPN